MPPKLADEETVFIGTKVPASLLAQIEVFAEGSGASRSAALRELVQRGLAAPANPAPDPEVAALLVKGRIVEAGNLAAKTARRSAEPAGPCVHPVTRRIGNECAACGAKVGK